MKVLFAQAMAGISGSELYLLKLLPALRARNVECEFLCMQAPADAGKNATFAAALARDRVPVHMVTFHGPISPRLVKRIADAYGAGRFDLLHTHLIHADFCGAAAKVLFRRDMRLVTTKHGYQERYLARHGFDTRFAHRDLYWAVAKASELAADHSAVVSAGLRNLLVAFGIVRPEHVTVIPHGFDFSGVTYDASGRAYRYAPRQLTIVGRLIPGKGHRFVLEVMPELLQRFGDVCLVLVGAGPLERNLRGQVRALGIDEHVRFEGYQRSVHDHMRASDVVLVPSLAEGFGVVTLEAWHNRKPVVGFDVPALNEIVRDGKTGYLARAFDTGELCDRIARLLENPAAAYRMGEAGYQILQVDYSIGKMVDATIAMYQRVLGDARRAA